MSMNASKKSFLKTLKNSNHGMSLIEILIAITLLGLMGTFVVGNVFDQLNEGKYDSAKIQIKNLASRLKEFRRHCNFYPTTEQGLDALIEKPAGGPGGKECSRYNPSGYIEGGKIPLDPWDNEFLYESDGRKFKIISLGADGIEGGEGQFDVDIHSDQI